MGERNKFEINQNYGKFFEYIDDYQFKYIMILKRCGLIDLKRVVMTIGFMKIYMMKVEYYMLLKTLIGINF